MIIVSIQFYLLAMTGMVIVNREIFMFQLIEFGLRLHLFQCPQNFTYRIGLKERFKYTCDRLFL